MRVRCARSTSHERRTVGLHAGTDEIVTGTVAIGGRTGAIDGVTDATDNATDGLVDRTEAVVGGTERPCLVTDGIACRTGPIGESTVVCHNDLTAVVSSTDAMRSVTDGPAYGTDASVSLTGEGIGLTDATVPPTGEVAGATGQACGTTGEARTGTGAIVPRTDRFAHPTGAAMRLTKRSCDVTNSTRVSTLNEKVSSNRDTGRLGGPTSCSSRTIFEPAHLPCRIQARTSAATRHPTGFKSQFRGEPLPKATPFHRIPLLTRRIAPPSATVPTPCHTLPAPCGDRYGAPPSATAHNHIQSRKPRLLSTSPVEIVIARDPLLLLERAAEAFLTPLQATPDQPFPSPRYLLALRQGGLRDDLIRLATARGVPGWFDPPLCTFQELPARLGDTGRDPCDDFERAVILGGVLRQLGGEVFGRLQRPQDFISALDRLFGDLVAEGTPPAAFRDALESRPDRDAFERERDGELQLIYDGVPEAPRRQGPARRQGRPRWPRRAARLRHRRRRRPLLARRPARRPPRASAVRPPGPPRRLAPAAPGAGRKRRARPDRHLHRRGA